MHANRQSGQRRSEPGLEGMREVLRGSLGRSLGAVPEEDRLAAAWMVACGRTLAGRGSVSGYSHGVVHVQVQDPVWLAQLSAMRVALVRQLGEASGLPVTSLELSLSPNKSEAR